MDSTPAQEAKKEAAKQAVGLAFMIAGVLIYMSVTDPDFAKTWRMRLAAASGRLLSSLSRRAGAMSMRTELRTGIQEYTLPYLLSRLRDRASSIYERSRHAG
jgi:hypothetical protein